MSTPLPVESRQTSNVFHGALETLETAAAVGKIRPSVVQLLTSPRRILEMRLPITMDDGTLRVFTAYRVHYCDALGPARDGTRIRAGLGIDELKALALFMTIKHAVAHLPAGGAKGGIVADPDQLSRGELERLCRSFIRHLEPKGPWADVPGADIGTSAVTMGWMLDEYEQIMGLHSPAAINDKPPILGGSLGGAEATGRGVFLTILAMANRMGLDVSTSSAAVQGFGQVGGTVARLLHQTGCRVVAVSDIHGGVWSDAGLDIGALESHARDGGRLVEFTGAKRVSNDDVLVSECEILIPAAVQSVVHRKNAKDVRAILIAEGANGPVTPEAERELLDRGVTIIPDVVANCGSAIVCQFERAQGLTGSRWSLGKVNRRLERAIVGCLEETASAAGEMQTRSLRHAAWANALKRIEEAMLFRGWI